MNDACRPGVTEGLFWGQVGFQKYIFLQQVDPGVTYANEYP